jgi:hypothetical protein
MARCGVTCLWEMAGRLQVQANLGYKDLVSKKEIKKNQCTNDAVIRHNFFSDLKKYLK